MSDSDTKYLWLIRHAKSEHPWGVADTDRPLSKRGRSDGETMANVLRLHPNRPQKFLTSISRRTQQTTELLNLQLQIEIEITQDLYMCSTGTVVSLVNLVDEEYDRVAVVTHSPTIDRCLWECENPPSIGSVPTLGMVLLRHEGNWREFRLRTAKFEQSYIPRSFR